MMHGKTEHRELPHPAAHPDQHGSIPMTDDRKPDRCVRHDCRRALAESRAECDRLRALLTECVEPVEWAEEQTYSEFSDYAKSEKFGEILKRVRAALNLEPTP